MTQPAKVQEPSMEEILASIRRIIADDEAKPASADKPANDRPASVAAAPEKPAATVAPVAKPVMKDIPPSPTPPSPTAAGQAAAAKPAPPSPKPAPPPPAQTNSQDDIDAMLASLDEATQEAEIRPPQPDGDVFELTDEMALPDPAPTPKPPPPTFQKVEPEDDIEFTEATKPPPPPRQPAFEPPATESSYTQQPILSRTTMNAVESAFNSLANTVLSNNARTLEDLVKEMLRPMLKSWLDDNLPGLVERIVKAEIERVSRGR
ncbi:PopZ family protein [Bradyrhizobium sp. USDA 10063]